MSVAATARRTPGGEVGTIGVPLRSPRELIVRGPNWLGDLVMATPGFRALRQGLPETRITLLVRRGLEGLMEGSPFVDEVIALDSSGAGAWQAWREARRLREQHRYDLGLCIPDSYSSALFMRMLGVEHIVGYGRGLRAPLLHRVVPAPAEWGRRRMVARERFVLGLVEALGVPARGTGLSLHVGSGDRRAAEHVLAAAGHEAGGPPLVLLAPGASYGPAKAWPAEHYAALGDRLQADGRPVALIGSAGERALCASVASAMHTRPIDLSGALSLGALKALIADASLLVCNDAGARHIAAAFGVPCLVFFGPTSVEKTNLNLEAVHVLERQEPCRPCYARECPIDHRCLRRIEPEAVARLALTVLATS